MILFDFADGKGPLRWAVVNDGVMGGLSLSGIELTDDKLARFSGELSLANGGGFASVKTMPGSYDLSPCGSIRIVLRGDGRRYHFRIRTTEDLNSPAYDAPFDTVEGEWLEVELPFDVFRPLFHGREVESAPPLDPASIVQFGLMVKDRQEGRFCLDIKRIEAAAAGGSLNVPSTGGPGKTADE